MKKIITLVKIHKIISAILIVVLVAAGYLIYKKLKPSTAAAQYITTQAATGTLTVTVSGTGQMAVLDQVDIKPQASGTITSVAVQQGQTVKAGDVIATIDQRSASNSIASARAQVATAQANYDKVANGATADDTTLAQMSVNSAQRALDNAKSNYDSTVIQQQQAVKNALNTLLNSSLQLMPSDTFTTATVALSGNYTGIDQGTLTLNVYQTGGGLAYNASGLGGQSGYVTRGLPLPLGNGLSVTIGLTGAISTSTTWTLNIPNTDASSYLNNLNSYNNAVQNQPQAIQQAQNAISAAQDSLQQAQIQFNQKTAPAASADLATAAASLSSAQAQLNSAYDAWNNTVIRSPFDGVVATLSVQKGDTAGSGTAVATVITKQQVAQISLNEVDVAKIKVGQKVNLTFDALDGLSLTGKVAQIDTLGTASQGVVNYTVKISLDSQDDQIKPGMSVSATIILDAKTDALMVPSSAVKSNASGNFVQILNNNQPQDKTVTVGLSNDTETEILSGLTDGESVVTQTITAGSTTATTRSTTSGASTIRIPGVTGGAAGGNFRGGN